MNYKIDTDDQSLSKFVDNYVDKIFEEMIGKGMTLVFKLQGHPLGVGDIAYAKIYAEYAKKMLDIWREERKYHPHWMKYAGINKHIVNAIDECSKIYQHFDPSKIPTNSLVSLFTVFLDDRVASEVRQANKNTRKYVMTIFDLLERAVHENRKLVNALHDEVQALDKFLESDIPTVPFELSLGKLPLTALRNEICSGTAKLTQTINRLIMRLNEWGALLKKSPELILKRSSFDDNCAIVGF